MHKYRMYDTCLGSTTCAKHLGILVEDKLNITARCHDFGCISRTMVLCLRRRQQAETCLQERKEGGKDLRITP